MATSLVETGFEQLYALVIGRVYSAADLGFVTRARRLQAISLQTIVASINTVLLPVFSGVHGDKARFHRGMRKAIVMLAAINFPLFFGLAVTSRSLIWILFGERWLPAAPYFSVLSMSAFLSVIGSANRAALLSAGESAKVLNITIFSKLSVIIGLVISYRFGVMAILVSMMVCTAVNMVLNARHSKRLFDYSFLMQLRDTAPFAIASVCMAGCAWLIGRNITNPFVGLCVQILCGATVYSMVLYVFFRKRFMDVSTTVIGQLPESLCNKIPKILKGE